MMKNMKGQAAMEFLMTYGWAILVVLLAIGALAAFGVFNLDKYAASTSGFEGQKMAAVNDGMVISLSGNYVEIALTNQVGTSVTLPLTGTLVPEPGTVCTLNPAGAVTATYKDPATGNYTALDSATILRQGDTFVVRWSCNGAASASQGDAFEATLTFDYINVETGQSRTMTGTTRGRYE
ncbi:hypothetical protein JXA48_02180 [Candidatus Woesearchaeota archaeon]|nr:hypothetical protein [Candidatus Woesearchaeota archaeon]